MTSPALTRQQIENWRDVGASYDHIRIGILPKEWRSLCDMALSALSEPKGYRLVPEKPDAAWFRQVAVNARVWPSYDVDGVPEAFIDAIRCYHSAMLAAPPAPNAARESGWVPLPEAIGEMSAPPLLPAAPYLGEKWAAAELAKRLGAVHYRMIAARRGNAVLFIAQEDADAVSDAIERLREAEGSRSSAGKGEEK